MKLLSYGKNPKGSTALCMFETEFSAFINDFLSWWSELERFYDCYNVNGLSWLDFFEIYDNLQPSYIISPTRARWVVFFDNSKIGGVHWSIFRNMAERLRIRSVGVLIDDLDIATKDKRPYSLQFMYADARGDETIDRSVSVTRDNNKWSFDQCGDPLSFEKPNEYLKSKKSDRLTVNLIQSYLASLGIDFESENFIVPERSLGIKEYVQIKDKTQTEAEIRNTIILLNQALSEEDRGKGNWYVQDGQTGNAVLY